jgi:integrase/recombinase XerD
MLERFICRPIPILGVTLRPMLLSRAVELVARSKQSTGRRPHWFDTPVKDLISIIGDRPIQDVTPDHILTWYDELHQRPHRRQPGRKLSAWTIDSYGRQLRAFFNELVNMGHLDESPARLLRLPRLPAKAKKEISQADIRRMVDTAEYNARDHALILVLRDSGARVGELVDMTVSNLTIHTYDDGQVTGRILITDQKTHTKRYAFLGPEAVAALQRYIRSRPASSPDWLWIAHNRRMDPPPRLTRSGIYQVLERVAERAGVVENWNPHAFRHALAKRMIQKGAPAKVVQNILGHSDISTTMNMYVIFDEDELADYHRKMID